MSLTRRTLFPLWTQEFCLPSSSSSARSCSSALQRATKEHHSLWQQANADFGTGPPRNELKHSTATHKEKLVTSRASPRTAAGCTQAWRGRRLISRNQPSLLYFYLTNCNPKCRSSGSVTTLPRTKLAVRIISALEANFTSFCLCSANLCISLSLIIM